MKYLIEAEIPKTHVLLSRPHINIEELLHKAVEGCLGTIEGVEVKVKRQGAKKKEGK